MRPQTPTEPVETEVSRKFGTVTPDQTRKMSRSIGKTKAVEEAVSIVCNFSSFFRKVTIGAAFLTVATPVTGPHM